MLEYRGAQLHGCLLEVLVEVKVFPRIILCLQEALRLSTKLLLHFKQGDTLMQEDSP